MDYKHITDALVKLIDYGEVQGWSPPFGRIGRHDPIPTGDPRRIALVTDDATMFTIDVRIHDQETTVEQTGAGT